MNLKKNLIVNQVICFLSLTLSHIVLLGNHPLWAQTKSTVQRSDQKLKSSVNFEAKNSFAATVNKGPSADEMRWFVRNYIEEKSQDIGSFSQEDPEANASRKLTFDRIKNDIGKVTTKGGFFYVVSAEFKDSRNNDLVELDFEVDYIAESLRVVDAKVRKVNRKERYKYDKDFNRIYLTTTQRR